VVVVDNNAAIILYERGVPFVDTNWTWVQKRIPNSHYLDAWSYEYNEVTLSEIVRKDQEIVMYSSGGGEGNIGRLTDAVALAVTWGYEKVYLYEGGIYGWKNAGFPVDNVEKEFYK